MRFIVSLLTENKAHAVEPTRLIEMSGVPADSLAFHRSRAYFCQCCGRVWATWEKEDSFDPFGQNWYCYHQSCPDHAFGSYFGDTPGDLIHQNYDIIVLNRAMLEYEFLTLMEKQYERPSYRREPPATATDGSSATDSGGG